MEKYETLYQNLYPLKHSVYMMTTLFCIKRLIYGLVTVHLKQYVVPSVYVYIFMPLFSIGYNLTRKPMNSKILNFMENLNESMIFWCGYFLLPFTQWICDPMQRYRIGWFFIHILAIVVSINFLLILFEMGKALRKANRKRIWIKKWNIYF